MRQPESAIVIVICEEMDPQDPIRHAGDVCYYVKQRYQCATFWADAFCLRTFIYPNFPLVF